MNTDWQEFLESHGAKLHEGSVIDFGDAPEELRVAANGNIICDLSHLDTLRIIGADAEEFLLNQLSNDIRQLDDQNSQLSTYCNPKGRMFGLFRLFRDEGGYVLISDQKIATSLLPRLKMFVMRSKVEIEDISEQKFAVGVSGPEASTILEQVIDISPPAEPGQMVRMDDLTIIRIPGAPPRFMISGTVGKLREVWTNLAGECRPVGQAAWEWLDIKNGLPSLHPAVSEQFIPQMLNLDILNALNFKKGCYPGQEIIARMKYLGKLKQRMFPGHVNNSEPQVGESIFSPAFGDQSAGTVVNARPSPEGGFDLLFVSQLKAIAEGELHLGEVNGESIQLLEPPYAIPLEGETAA